MIASGVGSKEKETREKNFRGIAWFRKRLSDGGLASACGSKKLHDERIVVNLKDPTQELLDHGNACVFVTFWRRESFFRIVGGRG